MEFYLNETFFRGTSTTRPKSRPSIMSDDEYPTQTEEVSSKTDGTPDDVQSPESSKTLMDPGTSQIQPSRPSFHVFGRKCRRISGFW